MSAKNFTGFLQGNKSESGKSTPSKFKPKYWEKKGRLLQDGTVNYTMVVMSRGDRLRFPLGTADLLEAAKLAAEIQRSLYTSDNETTLAKFKHKGKSKVESPTVGDYLEAVKAFGLNIRVRTQEDYFRALRLIVSQVAGIKAEANRTDYKQGGNARWLEGVHAVKLASLTIEKVEKWKAARLYSADNPIALGSARATINSTIRQAKSLFTAEIIAKLENILTLPSPLPFAGVKMEKRERKPYMSKIEPKDIFEAAVELSTEQFKIVVLGLAFGLRNHEADTLPWNHVDLKKGVIRIDKTEYFDPKSASSHRVLKMDPEFCQLFAKWKEEASGEFVIECHRPPKKQSTYRYERCEPLFKAVRAWLALQGVTSKKPFHELRKEFGSAICTLHGIQAACANLGHADIRVTNNHYMDYSKPQTSGMAGFLK